MQFGIVTPVREGRARFRACAGSVCRAAAFEPGIGALHLVRESADSPDTVADFAEAAGCGFRREPDAGMYDAVSRGLDEAAAAGCDVLSWLNADEQYLPAALGAARRAFESNRRIGLVFGDYLLLGPDGLPRAARREIPARRFYLRHGVNYLLSCTVFFRREVWEASAKLDRSYRFLADKKFYLGLLGSGVRAALLPEYVGAYAMTGRNASLDGAALAEQARLRAEVGAFDAPLARAAVRGLRVLDKAVHGCYARKTVEADLLAPDGSPLPFRGRLPTRWRWPRV